jgi:integrase
VLWQKEKPMIRINFYPDQIYKLGETPDEKILIKTQVLKFKRAGKTVPPELLNPKPTAIYLYVRIGDFTYKVKTGQRIVAKYWDIESQQVKRAYTGSPELNEYLNYLKTELQKNYRILILDKESISIDDIKKLVDDLFVIKQPKDISKEFFEAFKQFVEVKASDKSKLTIKKYQTLFKLLEKFQQTKEYKVSFEMMNIKFYDLFKTFLIKDQHQTNNTIGKYVSTLKTFLHWATDREYNSNLTFKKFKVPNESPDIIYLTEKELFHIYNFNLDGNKTLESVRDVFCFGCFTGARFSDIFKLTREDIKWNTWHLRTTKTRDKLEIPMNEFALEILEKYTNHVKILPTMSNQKTNSYLKQLGKLLDLNERTTKTMYRGAEAIVLDKAKWEFISTHTARRTFVTLSLEKGMRPEVLMTITGHKDYKTMKKYLKIISKVKETEMNSVWKRDALLKVI